MSVIAAGDGWIDEAVKTGGYPALAGLILAENLFPPIPSELILPLAGFYVGQGELIFLIAVLAATIGSVVGALILYVAARRGGRPLIYRHPKLLRLKEADLDRADAWFDRHGSWIVLFGRLIPGVRSIVSVPAGLSEMPLWRFIALTTLGSAVWNSALIGAGWALGDQWGQLETFIGPLSRIALVAVVAGIGVFIVRRWQASRRLSTASVD
ncbi:MAG: DedA family protein [Solirubrobacteraceae bacterium]|nr:DedA family protein [Solirubrobacteraceae bacterium]